MKCLVTGGAGFIGSNLALELEKTGNEVTILDNLFTGNLDNLKGFKGKFIKNDIRAFKTKEKFDVIFHEAAITDARYNNDKETEEVNIAGFKKILEFAKNANSKLVYASSASVYGNGAIPMKENQEKQILSAYSKSKLMEDNIASDFFDEMHIVGLRYFNVFGPREGSKGKPASMINHLSKQILSGKNPRIFKFGEQKRDHIYVKDTVDATIKAVNAKKSGIYNVGTGIATSFNDLIKLLNKVLRTNLEPEYFDMPFNPETYQNCTMADISNAEKYLGFKSQWDLKEGIEDYFRNWGFD